MRFCQLSYTKSQPLDSQDALNRYGSCRVSRIALQHRLPLQTIYAQSHNDIRRVQHHYRVLIRSGPGLYTERIEQTRVSRKLGASPTISNPSCCCCSAAFFPFPFPRFSWIMLPTSISRYDSQWYSIRVWTEAKE